MFKRKRTFAKKKRTYGKRRKYTFSPYKRIYRSIRAVSRKIAGEVFKFESTPALYQNLAIDYDTKKLTLQSPLLNIINGLSWVMPLNWVYQAAKHTPSGTFTSVFVNGREYTDEGPEEASVKNPIWRNTEQGLEEFQDSGTQLQYRLKYIYINALFNASVGVTTENSDGALRIVIVRDKQPTGGTVTWHDDDFVTNSRGVFNANRINAQLNPNSLGRFSIMYDKTLRFNTINGYKPFKYFKRLSTIVRNNRGLASASYSGSSAIIFENHSRYQTSEESAPVQKNAYYLMMFPDGVSFTHSTASSTPGASFNLFSRVAYYNN